ncbi:MAG TPA: DUF4416 family protein [bacterium]|nr:DUF4416 family protein [bacterium]
MAEIGQVQPVQLIAGVLYSDSTLLAQVEQALEERFSPIELRSEAVAFDVTDYYGPEMGSGLKRIIYAFRDLISPEAIAGIKLATNDVEAYFAASGGRRVNIDPGYIDFHKLVLASVKFLGHKIYIGKGVYADPTLYYDKGWKPYPWGFPDFKDGRYNEFLTRVRAGYKAKLKVCELRRTEGK